MDRLQYVAKALLVYETLDAEQFVKAFNKELPLEVLELKKDDKIEDGETSENKEGLLRELKLDQDLVRNKEDSDKKDKN